MCRIVGVLDKTSQHLKRDVVAMRDAMYRGGPDSAGLYYDAENCIAFGHRRLSIIDISNSGNQPMANAAEDIVIIFNGEIYNYLELRQELVQAGYTFNSHSDTEVILRGYENWGTACFTRFKGMFAIAIWDKRKQIVVIARDHAGIKPLYYYKDTTSLYFASEVRAFNAIEKQWEENPLWKVYFLTYGFLPHPITTLKDVKPLEKGSFIVFHTETLEMEQSFFYQDRYAETVTDSEEAKALVQKALHKAVERHLIADAPIGLFLSGGLDSSLLTILAKEYKSELHTLSIIFGEEKYSEKYYQDIVSRQVDSKHQAFLLDKQQFEAAIPDIMAAMDQPSTDGINSYFISKFAKEAGLKAVLSGLGADELFGGYPSFQREHLIRNLRMLPNFLLKQAHRIPANKYQKVSFLGTPSPIGNYLFNRGYFIPQETAQLFDLSLDQVNSLLFDEELSMLQDTISEGNKNSFLESNLYMQSQLLKDTDFMSMWHSIEVRVPFLDYDLIATAHRISSQLKFANKQGKFLLIDSFREILPQEIWDRKKRGFQLPFDNWMQSSLDQYVITAKDIEVHKKFTSGQLNWSRYWAYILSQTFKH